MSKNVQNNRPIKEYQNQSFKKSKYTQTIEKRLFSILVDNDIYQKSLNTTVKTLSKLNPTEILPEIEDLIDMLIDSINKNTSIKEIKLIVNLINSKLENLIKQKQDIVIKETINNKKIDTNRLKNILFKNRFLSQNMFFVLFYCISLLTYTKDKNVIFRVNNLSDNGVIDYIKKNYKFFSFNNSYLDTLYSYGGGKKKFYKHILKHIKQSNKLGKFKKFIDPFFGGGGSFYSSYNVIKENNISCILNDLNPSILNLNKHIQNKKDHKQIMKNIASFIKTMFIKTETYKPSVVEYKKLHKRLLKILNYREKKEGNNTSVMTSSILLFLLNNNFGGNYKTTKEGSQCSIPSDMKKVDRFFNFVGKIEFYHYLYTSVKVQFENKDYKEILEKHSRKSNTYTTIDPPYLNINNLTIMEFDKQMNRLKKLIKNSTTKSEKKRYGREMNKLLEGSPYNYGMYGDKFKHEQLLKDLEIIKGEISYFNYTHPIIGKYYKKYGLDIDLLGRKSTNGKTEKGVEIKTKYETFMTGRITKNKGGK